MKFALVNREKAEAQPDLRGACAECQSEMIAHCGTKKIWHWKHKRTSPYCWQENETVWHRTWKDCFPTDWQEKIHIDDTNGERHIADIKTAGGAVIEFQHSPINPAERQKRERFYKDMAWVVDGVPRKRDYRRFCKGFSDLKPLEKGFFLTEFPDECFPEDWLESSAPVYFDFQGNDPVDQQDEKRSFLWCLFPGRVGRSAVVFRVLRKHFIEFSSTGSHLHYAHKSLNAIAQHIQQQRVAAQIKADLQAAYQQRIRRPVPRSYRL